MGSKLDLTQKKLTCKCSWNLMGKIPVILDVFAEHYFKRSQNLSPGWLVVCFPPRLAFLVLNFSFSPASVWRKTGENPLLETGLWAFPWIQPCRRDNKGLGFPRKSTQKSTPKNFWLFFRCSPLVVAANLKKGGFLLQAVLIHVTVHC